MREVCKSGAVVAAVVAVLEKQSQFNPPSSPPKLPPKPKNKTLLLENKREKPSLNYYENNTSRKQQKQHTVSDIKNRNNLEVVENHSGLVEENNFELAVKNFNTVAEDVERTFLVDDFEKRSNPSTTSLSSGEGSSKDNKNSEIQSRTLFFENFTGRKNCLTIDYKSDDGDYTCTTNAYSTPTTRQYDSRDNRIQMNYDPCVVSPENQDDQHQDELMVVFNYDDDDDYDYNDNDNNNNRKRDGIDSDSLEESSDSEGVHYINEGLATITEEDQVSGSSIRSSKGCDDDSSVEEEEDDSTLKDRNNRAWSGGSISNQENCGGESTSDLSSSNSSEISGGQLGVESSSTRCTNDFQWIRKDPLTLSPTSRSSPLRRLSPPSIRMEEELSPSREPPPLSKPPISRTLKEKVSRKSSERTVSAVSGASAPGSLDRRRHHLKREDRDQKSRSSHVKSPPRLDDFQMNLNSSSSGNNFCCSPVYTPYDGYAESFHRRHERSDPQRYGSSPMLMDHRDHRLFSERGSHPDIYGDCLGRYRHEMSCCGYHMPPPCCFYGSERGYHWTPPSYTKPGEQEEKLRKLQYEKDNLQLQVQVLTEQIEAQSDKITDLEKMLQERKQLLSDTEEKLQREVLSRSSLETQKLELMSIMSELKLNAAALERENVDLRNGQLNNNGDIKKPQLLSRLVSSTQTQLTSTPQHSSQGIRISPSPSPVGMSSGIRNTDTSPYQNEIHRPKTPPSNYKRQVDVQYGSLPRQQFLTNGSTITPMAMDSNANPQKRGVAFAETDGIVSTDEAPITNDDSPSSPTLTFNKNKGIRKFFGKIKRSGSGNLQDLPAGVGEFQRGGVRATAAARLGWSETHVTPKPDKPFAEWDTESICDWLQDLGLDHYIVEAKRWIKTGQQLQESSIVEIEKELNIKNPLHRKKLQLALIDTSENSSSDPYLSQAGKLDTGWVLRWLDDVGLPQHKENFLLNGVDGRVLHRLTIDDLALLHVTSLLHVASIKRGIQALRENNYEPTCLQRRSLPEDPEKTTSKQITLWTTHRVMEWLRAVDLAEYAPNLRGAGVHGGLMVLEPKFNSDLLASLLSIPPGKTLLRRHLNTHFKELLGKDIIQEKREIEATLGYTPLTPSSKLKVAKKSQFSLKRKKSKGEADYGDLVCPLNPDKLSGDLSSSAFNMGMKKMENQEAEDVYHHANPAMMMISRSLPPSISNSPVVQRHV